MAYTVNGVADRIKEMDFDASAWKRYTALCALAHLRGTPKKVVVARVFGTAKESSSFKGAWTISSNFFAAYLSTDEQESIRDMGLDEACKRVVDLIDDHMRALDVQGKNAYAPVAKYATKAAMDKALADEKVRIDEEEAAKRLVDEAVEAAGKGEEASKQAAATSIPDANVVQTALVALVTASDDEIMDVIGNLVQRVDTDSLAAFHHELGQVLANRRKSEEQAALLAA